MIFLDKPNTILFIISIGPLGQINSEINQQNVFFSCTKIRKSVHVIAVGLYWLMQMREGGLIYPLLGLEDNPTLYLPSPLTLYKADTKGGGL